MAVSLLCVAGLAAIYAVNTAEAQSQAIYIAVGIFVFWLVQRTHYRRTGVWAWSLYFFCLMLLIYMMIAPETPRFSLRAAD